MSLATMQVTKKQLPKSQIELTFELTIEDLQPYLVEAAKELSEKSSVEGFRPGKAPFEIIQQRLGDMAILQQATNAIIGKTFYQKVDEEGLHIVEQPSIDIITMAPGNPFVYKATVALLPAVTVGDFRAAKLKPMDEVKVKDEEVTKVINDLRDMRATEALVDRPVKEGDKVEMNFETFIDGVALPGGKAEKYTLVIGKHQMIPGFQEATVGMKKDETKEFELAFPKDYHNEKIASKKAKFKVTVLAVTERVMAEPNDEFAKLLGLKSMEELNTHLTNNLKMEKESKARQTHDVLLINYLIDKSTFEEIPDVLVNQETEKMVHELQDNVEQQGLNFADYLNHLKKKESDLRLDFAADALKRVKTAIAVRQIAINENLSAAEEEIHAEMQKTLQSYQMNPRFADQMANIEKNIESESSHRYFANLITNRKVMELLRTSMVKA